MRYPGDEEKNGEGNERPSDRLRISTKRQPISRTAVTGIWKIFHVSLRKENHYERDLPSGSRKYYDTPRIISKTIGVSNL